MESYTGASTCLGKGPRRRRAQWAVYSPARSRLSTFVVNKSSHGGKESPTAGKPIFFGASCHIQAIRLRRFNAEFDRSAKINPKIDPQLGPAFCAVPSCCGGRLQAAGFHNGHMDRSPGPINKPWSSKAGLFRIDDFAAGQHVEVPRAAGRTGAAQTTKAVSGATAIASSPSLRGRRVGRGGRQSRFGRGKKLVPRDVTGGAAWACCRDH
jgi:hypothetical protein